MGKGPRHGKPETDKATEEEIEKFYDEVAGEGIYNQMKVLTQCFVFNYIDEKIEEKASKKIIILCNIEDGKLDLVFKNLGPNNFK